MIDLKTEHPSTYYNIDKEIGKGGFGKVYLCTRKSDGEPVAMKFVEVDTEKQKKYLGNELTLMKSLSHPNILKIYDSVFHEKTMYLFMQFMDGGALTDIVVSK